MDPRGVAPCLAAPLDGRRPRIAILGAGAVGSVLGSLLWRAGEDVVLVGRAAHVVAIRAASLDVEGILGGFNGAGIRAAQLVRSRLVTIPATASLDEAIATIENEGVRRLLVTTPGGRLAGIVSLDDLLEALAAQMVNLARGVRGGLAREATRRGPLRAPDLGAVRVPVAEDPAGPRRFGA